MYVVSYMKPLEDYIAQCMDDTGVEVPIDKFMEAFCARCLNPECKRSKMNDLKWQQRMERQIQALNNPKFGDPDDPALLHLSNQSFESFDKRKISVDSWESFEGNEPSQFEEKKPKKDPIIHRADPPTQQHEGGRLEKSLNQLASTRGKEKEVEKEPEVVEEDSPEPEVVAVSEPAPDPEPAPKRTLDRPKETRYNTEVPKGGIMLPSGDKQPSPEPTAPSQPDSWAVPDKGKKTLVVRAKDGKVVDKKPIRNKTQDEG